MTTNNAPGVGPVESGVVLTPAKRDFRSARLALFGLAFPVSFAL
jgi:hypothetical protein